MHVILTQEFGSVVGRYWHVSLSLSLPFPISPRKDWGYLYDVVAALKETWSGRSPYIENNFVSTLSVLLLHNNITEFLCTKKSIVNIIKPHATSTHIWWQIKKSFKKIFGAGTEIIAIRELDHIWPWIIRDCNNIMLTWSLRLTLSEFNERWYKYCKFSEYNASLIFWLVMKMWGPQSKTKKSQNPRNTKSYVASILTLMTLQRLRLKTDTSELITWLKMQNLCSILGISLLVFES